MFRFRRRKRIKKQVTDEGIVVYTTVAGKKLVTGVMSPLTQKMEKERRVRRAYAVSYTHLTLPTIYSV